MAQPGLIDFSPIGELGDIYNKAQERAKASAFEDALKGMAQGSGPIDYNALVRQALAAGYTPGIELGSKLKQAEATTQYHLGALGETKRYHDILAGQTNRPVIQLDPVNPLDPTAPRTGTATIYDKSGNLVRVDRLNLPPGGAAGGAGTPGPRAPGPDYWQSVPTTVPQYNPGPQSALEQPGGPALAQAPGPFPVSPSDELIARAQGIADQPEKALAQYAQAGGPPIPPPTPQQPTPQQLPAWAAGATNPVRAPTPPPPQAPNPLGRDQQGELRYTAPLGPFNEAAIANQPAGVQQIVRALATGRSSLATQPRAARPLLQQMVQEYMNGLFDETLYARRQKTINAFGGGSGAFEGRNLRAINNLSDHLDTARDLMLALENGQTPIINAAINKFREVTGYRGELPAQVKAAAPIIAGEMSKVIAGTGSGGVGERAENELRTMSTANSPKVALSSLNAIQRLMGGQMRGLEQTYENNTYNTDFRTKLSPRARQIMDELDAAHGAPGAAPSGTSGTIMNVPFTIKQR